jgi:hypothetical protein
MSQFPLRLVQYISSSIVAHMDTKETGHCLRIDNINLSDAQLVARTIRDSDPEFEIWILRDDSEIESDLDIDTGDAVYKRNLKKTSLVLLVPAGQAVAASLENSFEIVYLTDFLEKAKEDFREQLNNSEIGNVVQQVLRARSKRAILDDQVIFLATIMDSPNLATIGQELWRVGLIPDLDEDHLVGHIGSNKIAADALASPTRPVAGVLDRLTNAGLRDGAIKMQLQFYFESLSFPLSDINSWCKDIGANHPNEFTFEKWPLAEQVDSDLVSLTAAPFRKLNGKVEPACKLQQDSNGNLYCEISEASPAKVGIGWVTNPAKVASIATWRLDLVPPSDLRDSSTEPIITTRVKGDKRRATLAIDLNEEDLVNGNRFVVQITALDENGDIVKLTSGLLAEVDTDEFDVLWKDVNVEKSQRKGTARSVADAVLQAAFSGVGQLSEEVTLELKDGFIGLKIAERRQYRIPVSQIVVDLQNDQLQSPGEARWYAASVSSRQAITNDQISSFSLNLPNNVMQKRQALLKLLADRFPRHLVESAKFDDELRAAVRAYSGAYRRALENSPSEQIHDLLLLDQLVVTAETASGPVKGALILPTHPLRLQWIADHDALLRSWAHELTELETQSERSSRIDINNVRRISPANIPFMLVDDSNSLAIYAEEATYGSGLYVFDTGVEFETVAEILNSAIGLARNSTEFSANAGQIRDRISQYQSGHSNPEILRILNLNPGEGRLLSESLTRLIGKEDNVEFDEPLPTDLAIEVVTYSSHPLFAEPVKHLSELQARRSLTSKIDSNHLRPPMRLTIRNSSLAGLDQSSANLALVQDISHVEATISPVSDQRSPSLSGLLVSTRTQPTFSDSGLSWTTTPAIKGTSELATLHRCFLEATSKSLSGSGIPSVVTNLDSDAVTYLRAIHSRSDWVITSDRYLDIDMYDDSEKSGLGRSYTLDYTPDFIEGFGNRLAVTTIHREELTNVLSIALEELGLAALGSQSLALDMLNLVSGRLALRLLSNSTRAREAVSLAALMSHLKIRGRLDGQIVIPIDSHPEIFGQAQRNEDEGNRRCDLLLVKVTNKSFRIECVEVKSRQYAALPSQLAESIVEQLRDTESILQSRFFASDPARIDQKLQRATFCSLLHYYADRAALNGLIDDAEIQTLHRNIERLEESDLTPEINLSGYVIAIQDAGGFPERYSGVPLTVLTANEIGVAGFTTKFDAESRIEAGESFNPRNESSVQNVIVTQSVDEQTEGTSSDSTSEGDPNDDQLSSIDVVSQVKDTSFEDSKELSFESKEKLEAQHPIHQASSSLPESVTVVLGKDTSSRDVEWTVSTKGSPHAFIIGIPGQGKSVTTRHLIRTFADRGLPSIVFDFHGDMAANPPKDSLVYDVRTGLPFSPFELRGHSQADVNMTSLEVAEIIGYVCSMGPIQQNVVYKALVRAYEANGWVNGQVGESLPSIEQFADAVQTVETENRAKNVRDRLLPLTDFGLFNPQSDSTFDPRGDGRGLIVDVSQLGLESVQLAASAFVLRKIYKEMFKWEQSHELRLAVILDEAHRLAKDRTLPRLMKEGRKYGVSVVVASQGVDDFHKDVLGNAGVKVVFRTNFPASKTVAGYLRGRAGQDLSKQIELLGVGEAYVSTPDNAQAQRVLMLNSDE